ncbi:polygalacturonase-like [Syzygium oleosum]|uniref:polygalacturonase-like n=1 Tax=Syzygium oleosum TaxID=219896 RepID=UPI0011D20296|nr:polygalacturonase-like [Syzygium oleosum]XP_056161309.1 polygalacturonase-like [Syzygium oleosum]
MAKSFVAINSSTNSSWLLLVSFFLIVATSLRQSEAAVYNVLSYGAKPDGRSDSTQAFQRAWSSACTSAAPATVYVPQGNFVLGPVVFTGPCKSRILFQIAGTLVAPSNYWSLGNSGYWILFIKVTRVQVYGGTLNAQGSGYWACRSSGKSCPVGAMSISFQWSSDVVISGITSMNSQMFHIAIANSANVLIRNVKIRAPAQSPNTDGIHISSSTGVTVVSSSIMTGDDCISIGPGSKNVWIKRIVCGPGHGISVGSLGVNANEDGVENVTVTGAVFTGTQNGVRIKSWARPSNGFARTISFRNILMKNVFNPIIIDQNYCPSTNCPNQNSGVKISRVTYKNIKGTSATQVAMNFTCSPTNPCWGIALQNIELTYLTKQATSSCKNAGGSSSGIVVPRSCF